MIEINIQEFCEQIHLSLSKQEKDKVKTKVAEEGGSVTFEIDGENYINNVSVWSTGLCDFEYIHVKTEERKYNHIEFKSEQEAIEKTAYEIKAAICRD